LSLVGDARPFVCVMPMSRLHYRTVFDVDVRGRSAVEAWMDGFPPVSIKIIDYDELRRYAWKEKQGTGYWGIPAPPADKVGREIITPPSTAPPTPASAPSPSVTSEIPARK